MKEDIAAFGKRNISEIRSINRELTEKALQMRCQGYLAQAKARLLSETIVEIDQSKKAVVTSHMQLQEQNKLIIAQKEQLEEKTQALSRSNDDLKNFAHVASHDLRSPLSTISMQAELLSYEYRNVLDEKALNDLNSIRAGVSRMTEMIDALLEQSKVDNQKRPVNEIDMNDLVEEQIALHSAAIKQNSASVTKGNLPKVTGNKSQLSRLIQNLLGNALKYGGERDGADWKFSVRDNGMGIDPVHFERLFKMFQRVDPSSEIEGSGIGLAACRRILDHHSGKIWVESGIGQGSTFFFTLPAPE